MIDIPQSHVIRFWVSQPLIRRPLIAVLVCAGLLLIVTLIVWLPVHQKTAALVDEITSIRRQVVDTAHAREIAQLYKQSSKQVKMLEKKLGGSVQQATLVANLARSGRKTGIQILSESYEDGKLQNGYMPLHHNLRIQGRYTALRKFLISLQGLPGWTIVNELEVERLPKGGIVKASIQMTTYRQPAVTAARGQ